LRHCIKGAFGHGQGAMITSKLLKLRALLGLAISAWTCIPAKS
jgi:hypothetical protein